MPKYTFVDTYVSIYNIEAASEEEALEIARETEADGFNMEFNGTELVAIDGNFDIEKD